MEKLNSKIPSAATTTTITHQAHSFKRRDIRRNNQWLVKPSREQIATYCLKNNVTFDVKTYEPPPRRQVQKWNSYFWQTDFLEDPNNLGYTVENDDGNVERRMLKRKQRKAEIRNHLNYHPVVKSLKSDISPATRNCGVSGSRTDDDNSLTSVEQNSSQ
jgi:hypothetical protein